MTTAHISTDAQYVAASAAIGRAAASAVEETFAGDDCGYPYILASRLVHEVLRHGGAYALREFVNDVEESASNALNWFWHPNEP